MPLRLSELRLVRDEFLTTYGDEISTAAPGSQSGHGRGVEVAAITRSGQAPRLRDLLRNRTFVRVVRRARHGEQRMLPRLDFPMSVREIAEVR